MSSLRAPGSRQAPDGPRRALGLWALAIVSHLAWLGAWGLAPRFGIWSSLGPLAFVLGGLTLLTRPRATRALLRPSARGVGLGLLSGAVLSLLSHALYPLFASTIDGLPEQVQALYGQLHSGPGPVGALPVFIVIIVAEELLWRGAFFAPLERRWGRWGAAVAVTVPYALAQAGQGTVLLVVVALLVGLVFALLRALTRELWAPLLCHLVWDLAIMVAWPLEAIPG